MRCLRTDSVVSQHVTDTSIQPLDSSFRCACDIRKKRSDICVGNGYDADMSRVPNAVQHGGTRSICSYAHHHDVRVAVSQLVECSCFGVDDFNGEFVRA